MAVATTMKTNVHRINVGIGKLAGNTVPATAVKSGGMQQQDRVRTPRPLGDLESHITQFNGIGFRFVSDRCCLAVLPDPHPVFRGQPHAITFLGVKSFMEGIEIAINTVYPVFQRRMRV
jgi:hypothetical protein